MKKPVLLLNLLWIGIASGTFYAGTVWREGHAGIPDSGNARTRSLSASSPLGSGNTPSPGSAADADVKAFLDRHGLKEGVPLSAEAMGKAITDALRETDPIRSQMLFGRLMAALTPENAPAALAMIRENTGGFESMRYMGMLAYAWGGIDPKGAMEQLGQTGDRGDRGGRMTQGTALSGWASKDPAAAIAWMDSYKGEDKEGLTQFLIGGLAKSDLAAAQKYASALENKDERARASQTLARELIRSGGVDKATQWLATLTDPSMKSGAFESVAQQLMRSDPEQAADFIRRNASEDFARGAAADLAANLSRKDVQEGLAFAASLPGQSQARAYGEVISQWMERNDGAESVQASEYVNKMPAGPARDAGAAIIAREIFREDPAASIAWAGSISDTAQREQALVMAGRRYLRSDPQAGAAWLAQSGLSAEAQQQITAPREERRGPPDGAGAPQGQGGGFQRGGFQGGGRRDFGGRGR